jgi:hypothetical protein
VNRNALWRAVFLAAAAFAWMAPSAGAAVGDTPSSTIVSRIADGRVRESSGLAYSVKYPNLAYTMNDSKNRAMVYAIQVSTGRVVGQVDLENLDLEDPESIAVDRQGRVWLGDLGDNDGERDDTSIVVFDEPGPGKKAARGVQRFPIALQGGPRNVEGMMVYPSTRQVFLISKTDGGSGTLYVLPQALRNGEENVATNLRRQMPARVSDATFTPDGRFALMKTATGVVAYDVKTWQAINSFETPGLDKGESLTVEPGGRSILMGSEGDDSPIVRMTLPAALAPGAATTSPSPASGDSQAGSTALPPVGPIAPNVTPAEPANVTVPTLVAVGGLGVIVAGAAAVRAARRRRRIAHRHRRLVEHGRI